MLALIRDALGEKPCTNINFLPFLEKNAEVNDFLNAIDIDLTGLSGAEGWNLPAFNATCLGKWSVVLNETSHKDWANEENSLLVSSSGTKPIYDNVFFKEGSQFNQGEIYTWDEEEAIAAMEAAVEKSKTINTKGIDLGLNMTYTKTVEGILNHIK